MQNLSKKQWGFKLNIKSAADIAIEWCIRAREKNVLTKRNPQIYYSCILDDTPSLNFLHNISLLFKYSQKDVPYIDFTRDSILRCLSVAIKTHFFLSSDSAISHEPYYFVIPSISHPEQTVFGLVYKLDNRKTILVCEKDLLQLFPDTKNILEFNTIVSDDSFKWFSLKNWSKLKQESTLGDVLEKPWVLKKQLTSAREAKTVDELKLYSTIIDIPYELKDFLKPLGIEWNKHLQTWFLPKGFDIDSVTEYLSYLKLNIKNQQAT